ncbi:MAG TPA: ABC transporter permease [Capillimicrobium sp.]|nr:ABC transporter permease [Capillimicrobium sp.]
MADTRVIVPPRGWQAPNLRELWEYRDLAFFLVKRDVSIRYRQTLIGTVWAILQPLLLAVVFSVFLGHYARVPSGAGVPYPVFALAGMVMWLYFSQAMQFASDSTVASRELIGKVWFPRMIIPIAAVLPPAIDFLPAFAIAMVVQLAYGVVPPVQILLVPVLAVLTLAVALGIGLWLSALNVRYRDIRLAVPFLILVGLFVTPIVYPFDVVPEAAQPFYALNPMVGVLETYRWMIFPDADWPGALLAIPLATAAVLLVTGAWYFTRAERDFADVI